MMVFAFPGEWHDKEEDNSCLLFWLQIPEKAV